MHSQRLPGIGAPGGMESTLSVASPAVTDRCLPPDSLCSSQEDSVLLHTGSPRLAVWDRLVVVVAMSPFPPPLILDIPPLPLAIPLLGSLWPPRPHNVHYERRRVCVASGLGAASLSPCWAERACRGLGGWWAGKWTVPRPHKVQAVPRGWAVSRDC